MTDSEKKVKKRRIIKRVLKHLGQVGMATVFLSLNSGPAIAIDAVNASETASQVVNSELTQIGTLAAKAAIAGALKATRSKPAMTVATVITCGACVPVVGAAASPGMCIACGILIAKTFG